MADTKLFAEELCATLKPPYHQDMEFHNQLHKTLIGSEYVKDLIITKPWLFKKVIGSGKLYEAQTLGEFARIVKNILANITSDKDQLKKQLRLFRHQQMMRIIWRDLNHLATPYETMQELSWMAQSCVSQTLNWLYQHLVITDGVPHSGTESTKEEPQDMIVLGMGKLGAHELNLSSDIDLIFAYPQSGFTWLEQKSKISNQAFFTRLGQEMIDVLSSNTVDGFVFRVDMRLRPYGDCGQLVMSVPAIIQYYQDQGRDWERYALIKARVIAGNQSQGQYLLNSLKPFIYRRYLDYSVIDALRNMKKLINQEGKRLSQNIKLGQGGIREIEFIAQGFQLIRGGHDTQLQQRSLVDVLKKLKFMQYLPVPVVNELLDSYTFLRRLEHCIQAQEDHQTHELPKEAQWQYRLAIVMGYTSWDQLSQDIEKKRKRVYYHFCQLFADEEESENINPNWLLLWQQKLDEPQMHDHLQAFQFDPITTLQRLEELRNHPNYSIMQSLGRARLDQFVPLLFNNLASKLAITNKAQTLDRMLALVEQVLRRTAYLVLLMENPKALDLTIDLCSKSAWIAEQLAINPVLLDELLDIRKLQSIPTQAYFTRELLSYMKSLSQEDLEGQMDRLRYFKNANVLRIAIAEIQGLMPLMKVSDYLTYLAQTVIHYAVDLAWSHSIKKYGKPSLASCHLTHGFMVIAYGKLGGLELSYNSDLDLVFVYQGVKNSRTKGPNIIDNTVFYTRLAQRIVHILSTYTEAGALYEIDLRLRPEGESGMLVTELNSFYQYQIAKAWSWEHQALVRARVVYGETFLRSLLERMRLSILAAPRNQEDLRQKVVDMRNKMRASSKRVTIRRQSNLTLWSLRRIRSRRPSQTTSNEKLSVVAANPDQDKPHALPLVDLKTRVGGIIDIEFIVQYLLLVNAYYYPSLARYTDNIRILEFIHKNQILSVDRVKTLEAAYKFFRSLTHRLVITQATTFSHQDYQDVVKYSKAVGDIWSYLFIDGQSEPSA